MSKKKKVKPRRRTLSSPVARPSAPSSGEAAAEPRLQRLSRAVTVAGAVSLLLAVAVQFKILSVDLGSNGANVLKVAGIGLLIAGFVFGRAAKR